MQHHKKRRTQRMHPGRLSIENARYFITIRCNSGAELVPYQDSLLKTLERIETDGAVSNICATIMPDHIHWLFILRNPLKLGQVIGKWKVRSRAVLHMPPGFWQRDYFEHRLRFDEAMENYGRYIFMNPYRSGLISTNELWSGTRFWATTPFLFLQSLREDKYPQPEWLKVELPFKMKNP